MVLYMLLKDVNKNAARAIMIIVAIATTIMCLNNIFQFAAVLVAIDKSYVAAFGAAGSNALVMLLLDMHHYGFLIAQIFSACGWYHWAISPTHQGCFPRRWVSC